MRRDTMSFNRTEAVASVYLHHSNTRLADWAEAAPLTGLGLFLTAVLFVVAPAWLEVLAHLQAGPGLCLLVLASAATLLGATAHCIRRCWQVLSRPASRVPRSALHERELAVRAGMRLVERLLSRRAAPLPCERDAARRVAGAHQLA
ncbi:hypothetical protein ABWL39_03130 [Chitinivorax sp. PXF-14]|uniref:hypothetical protein n=1 Tax=Chitinivorax sp. PXF-14 TaxID=3230488 RepID=UPI0034658537